MRAFRVERGIRVYRIRRDQRTKIIPVVQILRRIKADAPAFDAILAVGKFLVLAIPIEGIADPNERASMRLYRLTIGVEPDLTRPETMLATPKWIALAQDSGAAASQGHAAQQRCTQQCSADGIGHQFRSIYIGPVAGNIFADI